MDIKEVTPLSNIDLSNSRQHVHELKQLNKISDLRIFRSVVEQPEMYMMNLRNRRQPQSIKGLVTERLINPVETEVYK